MLVYGDHARERDTRVVIDEVAARLGGSHDALVTGFILASELAQGIADAEFAIRGVDQRSATTDLAMHVLIALARAIDCSASNTKRVASLLAALAAAPLPATVHMKRAEGYAYYALYPEAYLASAKRAAIVPAHVIGIRSIGTGLAALIAAATGAPLPSTVRPQGDPFRRTLSVAPELGAEWRDCRDGTIAIADEGPGISGSSFGVVADVLEDHGITDLMCFPSHTALLGPMASTRHRERWQRVPRFAIGGDEIARERLARWLAPLIGAVEEPLIELSAGAWRPLRYRSEQEWPPSFTQQERLKFLARTRSGTWLARFVGLGESGEQAFVLATATSAAGFTPELAGLTRGFLVERWLADARPLALAEIDRGYLIDRIGRYLAFRARRPAALGASCLEQIAMVRRNVTLGIDSNTAERIASRMHPVTMEPVQIDGKLQPWEWVVDTRGALIKTDGYDHHASHDLIGCQDIAWDVVGAAIELELSDAEQVRLAQIVGAHRDRIEFARPSYLAFQLGRATLAANGSNPAEAERLRRAAARYAELLTSQ